MTVKKVILALLLLASAITTTLATAQGNAPGGAYIQCDPRNPRSPIRCTPDGW